MANQDYIISSLSKMREGDTGNGKPNSEAVNQKMGANINGLIDSLYKEFDYDVKGYFSNSQIFRGAPVRFDVATNIIQYQFSLIDSGSGGSTVINAAIYNDAGAFVNNLFGTGADRLLISGNDGSNVLIGRDYPTASTFAINNAGHSVQYGNTNLSIVDGLPVIPAGYILVPFIESFSASVRSVRFRFKYREQ